MKWVDVSPLVTIHRVNRQHLELVQLYTFHRVVTDRVSLKGRRYRGKVEREECRSLSNRRHRGQRETGLRLGGTLVPSLY